jgi:hypothetical protein
MANAWLQIALSNSQWYLGDSPDALYRQSSDPAVLAGVEIKCPDSTSGKLCSVVDYVFGSKEASVAKKPAYIAQMEMYAWVLGCPYIDFVKWSDIGTGPTPAGGFVEILRYVPNREKALKGESHTEPAYTRQPR